MSSSASGKGSGAASAASARPKPSGVKISRPTTASVAGTASVTQAGGSSIGGKSGSVGGLEGGRIPIARPIAIPNLTQRRVVDTQPELDDDDYDSFLQPPASARAAAALATTQPELLPTAEDDEDVGVHAAESAAPSLHAAIATAGVKRARDGESAPARRVRPPPRTDGVLETKEDDEHEEDAEPHDAADVDAVDEGAEQEDPAPAKGRKRAKYTRSFVNRTRDPSETLAVDAVEATADDAALVLVEDAAAATASEARPVATTKHGLRHFVTIPEGIRAYIQNCVCTINLTCRPDLQRIGTHARNAEYNPSRFSAAILRLREPRTTALVFSTGKVILTGAKNEDDAMLAARKVTKVLQKLGDAAKCTSFTLRNMVASGDFGFPVRLEGLAQAHLKSCSYEPELFPGLIYRVEVPKVVVMVFVSGRFVVTGAKQRSDIVDGLSKVHLISREFGLLPKNKAAVL